MKRFRGIRGAARAAAGALMLSVLVSSTAFAQGTGPNTGNLTFTAAFDVPSIYMFRGIRQEVDPALTMFPYADLGIKLSDNTSINFGVWNSLNTGSSGTGEGGYGKLNYEEDFYASVTGSFGGSTNVTAQYTSYTSPNSAFSTVKELLFKVSQGSMYAPYGLIAIEMGGEDSGQADGGSSKGTYLELGVGPSWSLGGSTTVAIPVKLGISLADYYESPIDGTDHAFGYFDVGALVTVPLAIPSRFGSWNFHIGGDYLALGDTTKEFNINKDGETSGHKVLGLFGIGVSY